MARYTAGIENDADWLKALPDYLAARFPEKQWVDPRVARTLDLVFRALSVLRPAQAAVTTVILTPYSAVAEDEIVLVNVAGGIVNLPAIADHLTKFIIVKDATGNAANRSITVTAAPGETIDGETSRSLVNNWQSFQLVGSGTNWSIV